jgi:hypothetical protein
MIPITDISADISRKQELIEAHKRRLHVLEMKAALLGIDTPPQILIEIEGIKGNISVLSDELKAFQTILVADNRVVYVEIKFSGKISDFTSDVQQETLQSLVGMLGIASNQVKVLGVYEGSVIIRISMPISGAARLVYLAETETLFVGSFLVEAVTISLRWPLLWISLGLIGFGIGIVRTFLIISALDAAHIYNRLLSWFAIILISIGFGVAIFLLRRSPKWRIGLVATLFIVGGALALFPDTWSITGQALVMTTTPSPTLKPTNTPRSRPTHMTATYIPTLTSMPTATPTTALLATETTLPPSTATPSTNSPQPKPSRTPEPAPTNTTEPATVSIPTDAPRAACIFEAGNDVDTIEMIIRVEAQAVNLGNIEVIKQIFDLHASIEDRTKKVSSTNPEVFYRAKFADTTFSNAAHPTIQQKRLGILPGSKDLTAEFLSTSSGRYESNTTGSGKYDNNDINDADKWTLSKASGCWLITSFSFK